MFAAGSVIPVGAALKARQPVFRVVIGGVGRTSVTTAVGVGTNFVVAPIATSLAKSAGIDPIWAKDIGIGTGFAASIFTGREAYKGSGNGAEVDEADNHIRETILNNIAESHAARNASRFGLSGTTSEKIPLSQKNVIKLLEQRGLNPEMAKSFNKSFDGTIYARRGMAGENFIVTENSFKDASAVFVTKGSAGATPIDRINNLALPPSNKALIESEVKLTKDQILLEGKVAPQPEWAKQAGDGIPRIGKGWQIVTNGGKWNGAVEWIEK